MTGLSNGTDGRETQNLLTQVFFSPTTSSTATREAGTLQKPKFNGALVLHGAESQSGNMKHSAHQGLVGRGGWGDRGDRDVSMPNAHRLAHLHGPDGQFGLLDILPQ